jgi:prolyl 4-hydroxylase
VKVSAYLLCLWRCASVAVLISSSPVPLFPNLSPHHTTFIEKNNIMVAENNWGDDDSVGSVDTEDVFLEMLGLPAVSCVSSVVADDDENDTPSVEALTVPTNCSRYLHKPCDVASFVVHNFLNADECQELIHLANTMSSTGFHYVTEAAHTDEDGTTHIVKLQEKNKHKLSVFEHPPTTQKLWRRLEPIISPQISSFIKNTNCKEPIGLNPRLRVLRYDAPDKDVFEPHFDATTRVNESTSLLTVLIYLNDGGGKDFDGGETCFLDSKSIKLNDTTAMVTPSTGDVVVFEHDLFHSSAPLKFGTKYILRTDVLFQLDQEGGVELPRGESKGSSDNLAATLIDVCQQLSVSEDVKNALGDIGLIDLSIEALFIPGEAVVKSILHDVLDGHTADKIFQAAKNLQ